MRISSHAALICAALLAGAGTASALEPPKPPPRATISQFKSVRDAVRSGVRDYNAGDKAGAAKVLEAVDLAKARESRPFTNLAINYINDGKGTEAVDLLTKVMARFPEDHTLLYYRGRAYIAATQLPEAKADLEKFVAAAPPGSPQMADARKLLEQLNKK